MNFIIRKASLFFVILFMFIGLAHFLHGFITGIIIPGVSLILIGIFIFFLSFIHEWRENLLQDIANIVTIIGFLLIFISIQSAWPLLSPRIEVEYYATLGMYNVTSKEQYAGQYAKITAIPPLFPVFKNTTYVIAHDIKWIEEQESNSLIKISKESQREIRIELNCDGWQWNKISERIYIFSDKKLNDVSIDGDTITKLDIYSNYSNLGMSSSYQVLIYRDLRLSNREDFDVYFRNIRLQINGSEAWNTIKDWITDNKSSITVYYTDSSDYTKGDTRANIIYDGKEHNEINSSIIFDFPSFYIEIDQNVELKTEKNPHIIFKRKS